MASVTRLTLLVQTRIGLNPNSRTLKVGSTRPDGTLLADIFANQMWAPLSYEVVEALKRAVQLRKQYWARHLGVFRQSGISS